MAAAPAPASTPGQPDQILDRPIRVANAAALPAEGEEGRLYQCADTRQYHRWSPTMKCFVAIPEHQMFRWRPIEQVVTPLLALLNRARRCEWFYFHNHFDSKYINIRVDMRDGNCLVTDNKGHPIAIVELEDQGSLIKLVSSAKE